MAAPIASAARDSSIATAGTHAAAARAPIQKDVEWDGLDKRKFLVVGTVVFSGLTSALYPLSVVRTRLMLHDDRKVAGSLAGGFALAGHIVRSEGPRALWKGLSTVLLVGLPARLLYMTTLEGTKAAAKTALVSPTGPAAPGQVPAALFSDAAAAGLASFAAGFAASVVSQAVVVPMDVISQRLMMGAQPVHGRLAPVYRHGLDAARGILAAEGLRGLYRGFGLSLALYAPSGALWWGSYDAYKRLLRSALSPGHGLESVGLESVSHGLESPGGQGLLQLAAGLMAGVTSACLTNPLDVVKTRLQVEAADAAGGRPTARAVVAELYVREGLAGFYRGLGPRLLSVSLWGSTMVQAYEFLKRVCALPPTEPPVQ